MRRIAIVYLAAATAAVGAASAQEPSLRADRTVEFRTGQAHPINATVGPVRVESVTFSDLGRGYGRGGKPGNLLGRVAGGNESEASTTLRARFVAENPKAEDWVVRFTLEFLDKDGRVIEKVSKSAGWEGEVKPYNLEHPILSYVVPLIARVRIALEARLD
jgi:hypothetical protein